MVCENLKALKDKRKLTNQQLSELSGVPLGTVNRIMAGQADGANFSTVRDLTVALGGSLDEVAGLGIHEDPGDQLTDDTIKLYEQIINDKDAQIAKKDAWLRRLFLILAVILAILVFSLVIDTINGTIGYIRYN